jgi:hypothetical protein
MIDIYKSYTSHLNQKFDNVECVVCHQMVNKKKSILIQNNLDNKYSNIIIDQLKIRDNFHYPAYICNDYCITHLKQGTIPPYSILNNMKLYNAPSVLYNLNYYEKLLIKKATCFQSIFKLTTLSRSNPKTLFSATKGTSVYLPLNTQDTLIHINQTLPNFDNINIYVDSLPNDQNQIWRNLVDMHKVRKALLWLKNNNQSYKNINIMADNFNANHQLSLNDENDNLTIKHSDKEIINHFSTIKLYDTPQNDNDIELYKAQRIQSKLLNDKDNNREILCFPNIYPFGIGGIYLNREIEISYAMYMRWILKQKNSSARKDIQYLFHLFHNKINIAVEQGIFAMIKTKKRDFNKTAANILDELDNNDKILEVYIIFLFSY